MNPFLDFPGVNFSGGRRWFLRHHDFRRVRSAFRMLSLPRLAALTRSRELAKDFDGALRKVAPSLQRS